MQHVADNTGLAPTDKGKSEKDVRNINFALNSEHVRETPTPKSGDKKRKASELAPVTEEDGSEMAVDAAEEPAAAAAAVRTQRAVFIAMPYLVLVHKTLIGFAKTGSVQQI